jgi:hypothetical protein
MPARGLQWDRRCIEQFYLAAALDPRLDAGIYLCEAEANR